jgi:nucleoside-diphosphate-sugar epimerase
MATPPVLILGATGFLGSYIAPILEKKGESYVILKTRLEDRAGLEASLEEHKPKRIICAAGVAGRPNIDWCETHRQETIRANVLGIMSLVDLCYLRNIHVTYFSSGGIYSYDEKHPLGSGIGFKEDEEPNFGGNFYASMRLIQGM